MTQTSRAALNRRCYQQHQIKSSPALGGSTAAQFQTPVGPGVGCCHFSLEGKSRALSLLRSTEGLRNDPAVRVCDQGCCCRSSRGWGHRRETGSAGMQPASWGCRWFCLRGWRKFKINILFRRENAEARV